MRKAWMYKRKGIKGWWAGWYESGKRKAKALPTKALLGSFYLPPQYKGEWRCDTHPRFSPDGRSFVVDSAHGGNGRQMYLIDISGSI